MQNVAYRYLIYRSGYSKSSRFCKKIIEIKYISMVQICKIHRGKYKLKFKHTLTIEGPVTSFELFITLYIYISLFQYALRLMSSKH